ncbi:4Fe-4S dicluster domain-containing protein [Paraeggerthella sp.]|uniref:4Fe-4S dicluster domain-containing protein n=1 Tax=Paraeggerthella sp. TaxID=2897350 RepID=UPI003526E5A2
MSCMHCQDAPCVTGCPTGASYHDENGCVQVDYDKCIGCRMCINVCPYNARTYPRRRPGKIPLLRRVRANPLREASRRRASHRRG